MRTHLLSFKSHKLNTTVQIHDLRIMVRCVDCESLHIRVGSYTTYFCLEKRDYVQDIDKKFNCIYFKAINEEI